MKKAAQMACTGLCFLPALSATAQQQDRPNIVVFLVDDMGLMDTSLPFVTDRNGNPVEQPLNRWYRTPNMERLAAQGIRFTQFYAQSVSSPSRTSLLTGQNAARHRTTNWINAETNNRDRYGPYDWNWNGLSSQSTTYPRLLRGAGYKTIHVGKAHFSNQHAEGRDPLCLGFDVNVAGSAIGHPASYLSENGYGKYKGWKARAVPGLDKYHHTGTFLTDALTLEAEQEIDKALKEGKPFYLNLAHYAVHAPFDIDKRFIDHYTSDDYPVNAPAFAALIEGMDKSLGDLLDHLDAAGIAENTLVIFLGDNGSDAPLGDKAGHASSAPYRGKKGMEFEGGMLVPAIMAWAKPDPANRFQRAYPIRQGGVQTQMATIMDIFPTILSAADIRTPKGYTLDGSDLKILATGKKDPRHRDDFLMHFPHQNNGRYYTVYRKGDWKIIYRYNPENPRHPGYSLYNLADDPYENRDLAAENPRRLRKMFRLMTDRLEAENATYPVDAAGNTLRPIAPGAAAPTTGPQTNLSDKLQPLCSDSNIFRDPNYFNWCNSIIKGDDGKYHLFYSRWKRSLKFTAWLTHSTIAHAVADRPEGPYRYVGTVLDFGKKNFGPDEMITAHNPKIKRFGDRYYLYFVSTSSDRNITDEELKATASVGYSHANWMPLRNRQRTYVASAATLDGPFTINPTPLLEPEGPISNVVVNPAITQGPDLRYYLIVKGDKPGSRQRNQAVAVSDRPDRDFKLNPRPVIQDWDTEDVSMWYDKLSKRFYAIFHAHTYLGMMTSADGKNWDKADNYEVIRKRIPLDGGGILVPDRLERPSVYLEDGQPKVLSAAVKKGNDSFIIFMPIAEK